MTEYTQTEYTLTEFIM